MWCGRSFLEVLTCLDSLIVFDSGTHTDGSVNFSLVLMTFSSKQEPSLHSTDSLSTA